jgi:hypothetical protein
LEIVDASDRKVIYSDSSAGIRNTGNTEYFNANFIFTPQAGKKYIIRVTSDNSSGVGDYILSAEKLETLNANQSIAGILDINSDVFRYSGYYGQLSDSYELKGFTGGEIINLNLSSPSDTDVNNQKFSTWLEVVDADTQEVIRSSYEQRYYNIINSDTLFIAEAGKNYIVRVNSGISEQAGSYKLQSRKITQIAANTTINNLSLTTSDIKHPNIENAYSDDFEITNLNPDKQTTVRVLNNGFQPYIEIFKINEQNQLEGVNYNYVGEINSVHVNFTPEIGKRYIARVSNYGSEQLGNYDIRISQEANILTSIKLGDKFENVPLSNDDLGANNSQRIVKDYQLNLTNFNAGEAIQIKLDSNEFDAYLEIYDATNRQYPIYYDNNDGASKNYETSS